MSTLFKTRALPPDEPTMTGPLLRTTLALVLAAILQPAAARAQADAKDWPTYNHDVLGSRYNQGEKAIGRDNAGRLEEKWRFPAKGFAISRNAIACICKSLALHALRRHSIRRFTRK